MEIKHLFDANKDIYRTIEKVITYGASQQARLKAEISEYNGSGSPGNCRKLKCGT